MAIPKKGSRKIVVNGENYRWVIGYKYDLEPYQGWGVSFKVSKENGFCDLQVRLYLCQDKNVITPPNTFGETELIVTPKLVAQAIEIALEKGWQPEQKGGAFELSLNSVEHNF